MDQRANSVADLAAVLQQLKEGPSQRRRERYEINKRRWDQLQKVGASRKIGSKTGPLDVGKEYTGIDGIRIYWNELRDAEFAKQWPGEVIHGGLGKRGFTIAWPLQEPEPEEEILTEAEKQVDREMEEDKKKSLLQRVKKRVFG